MRWAHSILASLALLLGSIIVASGLAEVLLRLTHYGESGPVQLGQFIEYDPLLGFRHIPNLDVQWHTREFDVPVHYNAQGWRDTYHAYRKPPNTSRIVIVGDSFGEGFGVAVEDRFSSVLQARLGRQFEVVNLAVGGYATDQKLLVLENEGWKFQPDIVVLELTYNDVSANGIAGTAMRKPRFVADGAGGLQLTGVPVPPPPARTRRRPPRSRLYDLLRTVVRQRLVRRQARPPEGLPRDGVFMPETLPANFAVYRKTESPQVSNYWSITRALLHRMKEDAEQRHARFLVFYVPTRVELSAAEWRKWPFPSDAAPGQVAAKITSICRAEGIEYVEPSERFRKAGQLERLYFRGDQHWTAAGHNLAGNILAERIQDSQGGVARQ